VKNEWNSAARDALLNREVNPDAHNNAVGTLFDEGQLPADALPTIFGMLRSSDATTRINAAVLLITIQTPAAIPHLIDIVANVNERDDTREAAAGVLESMGLDSLKPLIKLLYDSDVKVWGLAEKAIKGMKNPDSCPYLIELIHDERTWSKVIDILAAIPGAGEYLKKAMRDPDAMRREKIVRTIAWLPQSERASVNQDLVLALDDHNANVRRAAIAALRTVGNESRPLAERNYLAEKYYLLLTTDPDSDVRGGAGLSLGSLLPLLQQDAPLLRKLQAQPPIANSISTLETCFPDIYRRLVGLLESPGEKLLEYLRTFRAYASTENASSWGLSKEAEKEGNLGRVRQTVTNQIASLDRILELGKAKLLEPIENDPRRKKRLTALGRALAEWLELHPEHCAHIAHS
jgi:HEAT repeat protein